MTSNTHCWNEDGNRGAVFLPRSIEGPSVDHHAYSRLSQQELRGLRMLRGRAWQTRQTWTSWTSWTSRAWRTPRTHRTDGPIRLDHVASYHAEVERPHRDTPTATHWRGRCRSHTKPRRYG